MAQYRTGSVAVAFDDVVVTGAPEVDWTGYDATALFNVEGGRVYELVELTPPRQLTLATPYQGQSNGAAPYALTVDFTPHYGIPLISSGDIASRELHNKGMLRIDERLATAGLDGGAPLAASYITLADYPLLTEYRRLIVEGALEVHDGGPTSTLLLSLLYASQAVAEAGTDPTRLMSALTTRQALVAFQGAPRAYAELTGAQLLNATLAPQGIKLVNTGPAAVWTAPTRIALSGCIEVSIHNLGSGAVTFAASGPTLTGLSSVAVGASVKAAWARKVGGTERFLVFV